MSHPTIWVVGNWKQNHLRAASKALASDISAGLSKLALGPAKVRVGIAPNLLALDTVEICRKDRFELVAQNAAAQEQGAFTGEVGPSMLRESGVSTVIIGHSERRAYYGEHDSLVAQKVKAALDASLRVILCVGEGLEARERGDHENVVISQLSAALAEVSSEVGPDHLVVAYEPVWAIGTGKTASPEQASAMHRTIREKLAGHFGSAFDRSILYGGSVKPGNAAALLAAGNIDGFLVGGASLDRDSFLDIVRAATEASGR